MTFDLTCDILIKDKEISFKYMKKSIIIVGMLMLSGIVCIGQDAGTNTLYNELCSKCHAKDGSGNTTMGKRYGAKNYTDATVQNKITNDAIDKSIKDGFVTSDGKQVMKPSPELTKLQRDELIKTMRSFKKGQ